VSVKTPVQTERQFERAIVEYAQLNGWMTWHAYDSRRSTPGWPDLAMARGGRLVLAELKTEKGRVSRDQQAWLDALGIQDEYARRFLAGQSRLQVFLWRPSDWPEVEWVLR
jgi:VRR-NUC domain-containing protein